MPDHLTFQLGANIWFPLLVIAVLEAIAIYTWPFRQEPGARPFLWIQVLKSFWLLALLYCSHGTQFRGIVAVMYLCGVFTLLLVCFWLRFITEISGYANRLPRWIHRVVAGSAALLCLLLLTNPWHGLIWRDIWLNAGVIHSSTGPLRMSITLTSYAISLAATWVNIHWAVHSAGLRRRQALLILLASLLSWTGHALTFIPAMRFLSPLPLSFLLSSAVTAWSFHRWRTYGLVPRAQEIVLREMIDGLLVVDESDIIVSMNAKAREIFLRTGAREGVNFTAACADWPALEELAGREENLWIETDCTLPDTHSCYRISITNLYTALGQPLGRVFIFKDVTRERHQQARILDQQKALSTLMERQRLGRELHDGPGQIWSFVSMQIQSAQTLLARQDYSKAKERLGRLAQVVREEHAGLRESITSLQTPLSPEQRFPRAVEMQLQWYREHCELRAELAMHCVWPDNAMTHEAEAQLLRIVQEALSNVRKSSHATLVQIEISRKDDELTLLIKDNGCGFEPDSMPDRNGHHGLVIMRERAAEIGARFTIHTAPGTGVHITLQIPLRDCESANTGPSLE